MDHYDDPPDENPEKKQDSKPNSKSNSPKKGDTPGKPDSQDLPDLVDTPDFKTNSDSKEEVPESNVHSKFEAKPIHKVLEKKSEGTPEKSFDTGFEHKFDPKPWPKPEPQSELTPGSKPQAKPLPRKSTKSHSATRLLKIIREDLSRLQQAGLYRTEFVLGSKPGPQVKIGSRRLVNFASHNYLGLATNVEVVRAAQTACSNYGTSLTNPRLLSAVPEHVELEKAIATFLGVDDSIVFSSGYQANLGLFETMFNDEDAIFYDSTCHPSLVDGIRLSRCKPFAYFKNDMNDLEDKLKRSPKARYRAIVADSVCPFDGEIIPLTQLSELAKKYQAAVILDDSLGFGLLGETGRGCLELYKAHENVDLITGSLGYAPAGSGGFVAGHRDIIMWLRHRARPYLFSNALTPAATAGNQKALEIISSTPQALATLRANTTALRTKLKEQGFKIVKGDHPIVPIITHDAVATQRLSDFLYQKGFYTLGFCFPVVPTGFARIRVQVSSEHTVGDLDGLLGTLQEGAQQFGIRTASA